ncbi:MAG: acetolactate synthase [Isosphaeraceae bacterium]
MSLGEGGGSELDYETLPGREWPTLTQYSVFLENRVGRLLEVVRLFRGSSRVRIVGLSIADSADCCIIRLILSHPEQGREILEQAELPFAESQLLAVELVSGPQSLADVCMGLLQAEVNIHYAYPLIVHPNGRAAVALHVDNLEQASNTLRTLGFDVVSEADLSGS